MCVCVQCTLLSFPPYLTQTLSSSLAFMSYLRVIHTLCQIFESCVQGEGRTQCWKSCGENRSATSSCSFFSPFLHSLSLLPSLSSSLSYSPLSFLRHLSFSYTSLFLTSPFFSSILSFPLLCCSSVCLLSVCVCTYRQRRGVQVRQRQ
jgi:hypothetical protein